MIIVEYELKTSEQSMKIREQSTKIREQEMDRDYKYYENVTVLLRKCYNIITIMLPCQHRLVTFL